MWHVRFMSLSGKFQQVREQTFPTLDDATVAVAQHASTGGYTNVKPVNEDMGVEMRFTARTPGGRDGRNVAFATLDFDGSLS